MFLTKQQQRMLSIFGSIIIVLPEWTLRLIGHGNAFELQYNIDHVTIFRCEI